MMRTSRLLTGCALGAMLAAAPSPAAAQSYQGGHTVVAGTAGVSHFPDGGPGLPAQTIVTTFTPQTVIEWRPVDAALTGAIDFQLPGTVATFQTTPANPDYTVLNRILPVDGALNPTAATVAFRGTTNAILVNNPGGHIWFYSPTGIIAGPTARFNVGSLILTTNNIPFNPASPSPIYGPGGTISFVAGAGSTGFVDVDPGALIDATGANAYVALVAPRVVQGGRVQSNGQVAYIAAEELLMTINGGVFDFNITVGTTDAQGVVHEASGVTTGPASTGLADVQRISMVALPKNDALTMLLAGSVGYSPAASAAVEGSSIVLAAGFVNDTPTGVPANRLGSIQVGDTAFTNPLTGYATDQAIIAPTAVETTFAANATFYAASGVSATAAAGATIDAAGDLALRAGVPGVGGDLDLTASGGGQVLVGGALLLDASGDAALYDTATAHTDAFGGQVTVLADGGLIRSTLPVLVDARATGQPASGTGGFGTGGVIGVTLDNNGEIETPELTLLARADGGASDGTGGAAGGGVVTLTENSGQLDLDILRLFAGARGGDAPGVTGDGAAGLILLDVLGQAQDWSQLIVDASGAVGAPTLGNATGTASSAPDAIRVTVSGAGAIAGLSLLSVTANTFSGYDGAAGSLGQAGGILVEALAGGSLSADEMVISADARFAGDLPPSSPVTTPLQQGGTVDVVADGGTITARLLTVTADAYGREGGAFAGAATGGTVQLSSLNGAAILVEDPSPLDDARLLLSASGFGAAGPNAADAVGGTARLVVADGSVTVVGDATVAASGSFGNFLAVPSGPGHGATGGNAIVELQAGALGTGSLAATNLSVLANGDARLALAFGSGAPQGDPISGSGGDGAGGLASVAVAAGNLTTGRLLLEATGSGGASAAIDALAPFASGNGTGGTSLLIHTGGATAVTTLDMLSNGIGGGGAPDAGASALAALAGNGTGGIATLETVGGTLDVVTAATIEALGTGGAGMNHAGNGDGTDGGDGTGGTATWRSPAGSTGSLGATALAIRGNGTGGIGGTSASASGGNGGDGTGMAAATDLADGSFVLGTVTVAANGTGADGATGGTGTGGQATFALVDSPAGPSGVRTLDNLTVEANGVAGLSGGLFPEQSDAGDVRLEVRALDAASALAINGSVVLNSFGGTIGAPSGIAVDVSGAPLAIGGNLTIEGGEIAIAAGEPLIAAADAFLSAERTYQSTGLVGTDGFLTVQSNLTTTADRLASGGSTFLSGGAGPLVIADLASAGPVTAFGQSIQIRSLGALQFASANAVAGDLLIETAGNLGAGTSAATGSVTLYSTAGSITGGNLTAGTWIEADATGAVTLGTLTSAIDVTVAARGGNLTVGDVSAGDEIWLSVFGADPARVLATGNLVSTGLGSDAAAGPAAVFGAYPGSAGPTGNVVRVRSSGSLALGDVQTPGRAILVADAGTTAAGAIDAPEALIVLGRGDVALGSVATSGRFYVADSAMFLPNLPDAYDPASLDGLPPVRTGGGLTVAGAVDAAGITVAVGGDVAGPAWNSTGALFVDAGGRFATAGTVASTGNASVSADGGIDLAALTSGGTTLLRATGGTVDVGQLLSAGAVTARGLAVDIASTGALTFADLDAFAGGIVVATTGDLALATSDATGATTLSSATGSVAATGAVNSGGAFAATGPAGVTLPVLASGGTTALAAANGAVDVDSLTSAGPVTASGQTVDIVSPGALAFASATANGTMSLVTAGNLAAQSVVAGGDVTLAATGGNLAVVELLAAGDVRATARDVAIASTGGLRFAEASATAGDVTILTDDFLDTQLVSASNLADLRTDGTLHAFADVTAATIDLRANADILADADLLATGNLAAFARGTFTLAGTGSGASIAVTSGNIALGTGARLGVRGTTGELALTNFNVAAAMNIGGAAQGGYSLDQAEAARLFADDAITFGIAALPLQPGYGHIAVGDLALAFGANGNIGTGGQLEISTPAEIAVTGNVALATSGADDTFLIDPTRIELDTSTGGIAMLGAGGNPLGQLTMVGDTIAIASTGALVQLRTATDFAAINALLDQPGGNPDALRAGSLAFDVTNGLFIQNAGATALYRDRRGFTAGALSIDTAAAGTRIAVNGQILGAGGPVVGLDTQQFVTINGAPAAAGGLFDPASTINGCPIGSRCAPPPGSGPPSDRDIEAPLPDGDGAGTLFAAPLIELAGNDPLIAPPLVDEPITGVGNDDLWEPRCPPGEPGENCPEADGRP